MLVNCVSIKIQNIIIGGTFGISTYTNKIKSKSPHSDWLECSKFPLMFSLDLNG